MTHLPKVWRPIQPSGISQPGQRGRLFDAVLDGAAIESQSAHVSVPGAEVQTWVRPIQGLQLAMVTGHAAELLLRVGRPEGGAQEERLFTLTRRGLWLAVTGWSSIAVIINGYSQATGVVQYAWTAQEPPDSERMLFVQAIQPGTVDIPEGATDVAPSLADVGWAWSTDPTGIGALIVLAPAPGGGVVQRVLGGQFVTTVPNVVTWLLRAPA